VGIVGKLTTAIAFACLAGPAVALADKPPATRIDLEWEAAQGCPDRESARAAIEALLGGQSAGTPAPIRVKVQISPLPDGWWEARIATPDQ
jgi:hypothetical protein